jgi:transposase
MSTEDLNLSSPVELPNDVGQLKSLIALQSRTLTEREQLLVQCEAVMTQHKVVIHQHEEVLRQREATITSQHDTIEKQLKKLAGLEQQLARLLRRQYGPQKERVDPDQLTLFTAEELAGLIQDLKQGIVDSVSTDDGSTGEANASVDDPADDAAKAKHKGHERRPIPPEIPREIFVHPLNDVERLCPCCGKLRNEIGREVSEQLEYVPAHLKVLQHERVRFACDACEANVVTAPKPAQPIAKGLPGPGLLAHVTLSKYGNYLPLGRIRKLWGY